MDITKSEEQTIVLSNKWKLNSTCEFEVNFKKPLVVNEDSEIGLLEISLPNSVRTNLFSRKRIIKIILQKFVSGLKFANHVYLNHNIVKSFEFVIEPQRLLIKDFIDILKNDLQKFMDENIKLYINNLFPNMNLDVDKIEYNFPTIVYSDEKYFTYQPGLIKIDTVTGYIGEYEIVIHLEMDKRLNRMLGFDDIPDDFYGSRNKEESVKAIKAVNQVKELGLFDNFYVYSNIVRETYVGNDTANILRVFSRSESEDDIITYSFFNVFFVPLRFREINSIQIQICNSIGEIAIYDKGEINLILIIRPVN